jgi:hypothetical protein
MTRSSNKTPVHLWTIGILSLLWNAFGAFDYTATQYRIESYVSQFTPEQLDYFYAFPAWVDAAWAVGVWGSLLGSIFLLLRKSFSVWLFGVAILGLAGTSVYTFLLSNGAAMMSDGDVTFTAIIWAIALFLYFYASAMITRRVLG